MRQSMKMPVIYKELLNLAKDQTHGASSGDQSHYTNNVLQDKIANNCSTEWHSRNTRNLNTFNINGR